ncbi:MAG: Hsp33 family molecular chaperone HslO [Erysipelotrichaceae bacterium]|nr:Hsp33 family molecular chaperone HslO [Erysipelotrichaceae bacterium]
MKDILIKGLTRDGRVRVFLSKTTDLCNEARIKHDLWPTSTAALGRVLSIVGIMAAMLKGNEEKLTVQINGGGAIGTIMADGYPDGHVRGFVGDPHLLLIDNHTGKLAVGAVVGTDGYLRVLRDSGLKDDFIGTVKLVSGEIGEDFAYYFSASEQIPTAVSVGVLVNNDNSVQAAGALIIQIMPDAQEDDISYCEQVLAKLAPISELISKADDPKQLLTAIFPDTEIIGTLDLRFACDCSKNRMAEALTTISQKDLQEMITEDHGCELVCQYCNTKYQFSEAELNEIYHAKER